MHELLVHWSLLGNQVLTSTQNAEVLRLLSLKFCLQQLRSHLFFHHFIISVSCRISAFSALLLYE